ncbi:coiled-coil domain-containing protein 158 isoform X4 [Oncorhynchus tshawytscha]|uniref:coiled-coil domain-containing protein 158 isoform X4 n=1 Tax=Oncorhynchus tshawytscha TaxID=74940 RepID=UPI000D0A8265|nr:coiled-coil domain-containing protein 158 isoform X4 [Oncorhynchus tshawytscha]
MSSGFQNSISKDSNLSIYKSSELFDGLLHEIPTTSTNDTSTVPRRYNNLDELSEELDRRTKETQMLQEEVEHATKMTIEKMGRTCPSSSPSQINYFPIFMDGSSEENSEVLSVIQPLTYGLELVRSGITFPGKDVLENAIGDYSQQVSELQKQLSETHELHEQQKFYFRQSIIKLQTKLQEFQIEKDALTDLRTKESRKQADVMGKMQAMIRELQAAKQTGDQRLLEAEDEVKSQSRRTESRERTLQEVYSTLLAYEKRCGNNLYTSQDALGVAVEKVLHDLEHANHNLRESLLLLKEQMETQEQKCQEKAEIMLNEQRERMKQLTTSHDQEVAILTEKLSSSRGRASSLHVQVELLQKQGESQASVHQCQVNDLESALSVLRSELLDTQQGHEDKVGALEMLLAEAQSQAGEAQRGRDRSLQQTEELDSRLCQLTTCLEQREECLAVLEQERRVQQAGLSKQSCCVKELTLEKQQLTAELEVQRMQLVCLTEEHEELKRLHSSKSEEQEGVVVGLKAQLKTTRAELDQARSTLRTLEGADGHGLKVAMGMQKQITAKREQIDTLHGRIQLLEETMDKLTEEKRYQSQESKRQIQLLASVTEEKRQVAAEVETVRSLERRLREKVAKLETALHKMSESFVHCQDFIQLQEQEFVRLKLQHALDVTGQNLRATGNAQRASLSSPTALTALPSSQYGSKCLLELKPQQLLESPTTELRSLVKELRGVISENPGPHTNKSTLRRSSVPERDHRTTLNEVTKNVTSNAKMIKGTNSSGVAHLLRTTDLDERNLNSTFSSASEFLCHDFSFAASLPSYTSSPRAMALGRRSPVHSLLTSDHNPTPPPQSRPQAESPLTDTHTLANPQAEFTGHTCKHLQGKLDSLQNIVEDLQMKNQEMSSMIKGQEKRMRNVKDKRKL